MVLVWPIIDDSPNSPNFLPAKLSCYTVHNDKLHTHILFCLVCLLPKVAHMAFQKRTGQRTVPAYCHTTSAHTPGLLAVVIAQPHKTGGLFTKPAVACASGVVAILRPTGDVLALSAKMVSPERLARTQKRYKD